MVSSRLKRMKTGSDFHIVAPYAREHFRQKEEAEKIKLERVRLTAELRAKYEEQWREASWWGRVALKIKIRHEVQRELRRQFPDKFSGRSEIVKI